MRHRAVLGAACRGVGAPGLRGGGDEHGPRGRAGLAQDVPRRAYAGAAAGRHAARPAGRILRDGADLHLGPIGVQLFGDQHRQRGVIPLAHFGLVDRQRHDVICADLEPRVGRKRRHPAAVGDSESDDEPGTNCPGDLKKVAPFHQASFAARWIAARMRWYVPQRQMLLIAASISTSVGCGVRLSNAAAAMSWPDWQ